MISGMTTEPAGPLFTLPGDFDAFDLPAVSSKVDEAVAAGATRLVFDTSKVAFINSSALGYLIKTRKRLRELGGDLVIAEPSAYFRATIDTLGVDQIFTIAPTVDEALRG